MYVIMLFLVRRRSTSTFNSETMDGMVEDSNQNVNHIAENMTTESSMLIILY